MAWSGRIGVTTRMTGVARTYPTVACRLLPRRFTDWCEAAILAAGYAPAIGFLHTGKPQSFVYDVADLFKFETVVPEAFRVMAVVISGRSLDGERITDPVAAVRRRCRDAFRRTNLLSRLIPAIEDVLAAGGLPVPQASEEAQPIAIPNPDQSGDAGHRG